MKKIIILMFVLAMFSLAFADVIIGTGTLTQYTPMSTYWNYYRTAALYTATDISASGTITNLQWFCGTANTTTGIPVKIYMKYTADAALAANTWVNLVAGTTEVYNATIIANATGWFDFNITDFPYDTSLGNLMVLIETGSAPFVSPYVGWRYTSTSPVYKFLTANADGTIPTSLNVSYNRPNIKLVGITQAVAPGIASLVFPTPSGVTGVTGVPTLQWAPGTGTPTHYDIYFGQTLPAEGSPTVANHTLTNWAPGVLSWNTTYSWKIVPKNAFGSPLFADCPTWTFTTMLDPTIYLPPNYTQDFGTTGAAFPPTNWNKYSGVLASPTVLGAPGSGSWFQRNWRNVTATPVDFAAVINIYSTLNGWLISPPILVPGNDYEVKFDLALTDYYNSNPISSDPLGTTGVDDVFAVLIGDGISWTPANVVRQWDNAGSAFVYNNISSLGETVILPLGTAGTKYIAFYGISTVSNADNDLFVDNVILRQTPVNAVFNLTPDVASWNFGMTPVNIAATKVFTISNTGGAPLTLTSVTATGTYYSISVPPALMTIPVGGFTTFTVQYLPTATGGPFAGTLDIVFSRETRTVALSGSAYAPTTMPVTEGFEAGFGNFIVANGAETNKWYTGTATAFTGTQSAYISNDGGVSNNYDIVATSTVHLYQDVLFTPGAEQYNLSFAWKGYGESASWDYLQVFLVDTATTPVAGTRLTVGQIGVNYNMQSAWQTASIMIPSTNAGLVKRVVFSWWNDNSIGTQPPIAIDAISLTANMPSVPDPVTLTYPAIDATGLPISGFNLTWTPAATGGLPTYYGVYMSQIVDNIYTDYYWETPNLFYNPVTQGGLTFAENAVWYWTVEAFNTLGSAVVEPPYRFTVQGDPRVPLPYAQDFGTGTAVWPLDWTQTYSGGVTSNRWAATVTASAGGTANEMTCSYISGTGITRLITPPINTTGVTTVSVNFKHYYNDYGPGITGKVQYSYNLTTWYDAPWSVIGGGGDQSGTVTTVISGLSSPTTYVAWVFDGDHYQFDYWYVDDVLISVPAAYDVGVASIDLNEVYAAEPLTLKATIANYGINPATFNVEIAIDTWTSTYTGLTLAAGAIQQITFPSQFTPVANTIYGVTVTTLLASDLNAANNTMEGILVCLPLDIMAFADVAYDPGLVNDGPATFNLKTPGTITDLPALPSHAQFMPGADWMGGWYGNDYGTTNFWNMDASGAMTSVGTTIAAFNGIAYNPNANVWYGATSTELYTFDPFLGTQNLIGTIHFPGETTWTGLIIGLAYDSFYNVLYGIDLGFDAVISISTTDATVIDGYLLGIDINYAQDCAFDQTNGLIYLAAYTTSGALYWVHPTYGAFKVGDFQSGAELTGFAIPYSLGIAAPEVTIGFDGTLSWAAIDGANSYKIYGSDNPYGPFTLLGSTLLTSWSDPNFPQMKKFYQVVASSDARRNQNVQLNGLNKLSAKRLDRNKVTPVNSGVFNPRSK